ncbi:Peroxin/Dysferlin domain-containing protein [Sporodiniella umbellata]|nr:Peroxin/Dysferlin domain-containing protein [Sporodiniella umbellata]
MAMSDKHPSFSSPYMVQNIDQIPTPILKILVALGPFIHCAAQWVQILMWQSSQPRLSFLAVLVWVSVCLWTWQVLALSLPCLVLYKLAQDWLQVRTRRARRETLEKARQEQRKKREEKLKEMEEEDKVEEEKELVSRKTRQEWDVSLDDTLADLVIINHFLDYVTQRVGRMTHTFNEANPLSILSVLMYVTPLWIALNWWLGAHFVLAFTGALLLISPSPWFNIIKDAMLRNIVLRYLFVAIWAYGVAVVTTLFRFDLKLKEKIKSLPSKAFKTKSKVSKLIATSSEVKSTQNKGNRTEMIFQFEVYENQRWWLGVHWTTNMMPNERAPWTDSHLKSIVNKDDFQLPEDNTKVSQRSAGSKSIQTTTKKTWTWADGDWWVDMTGELQGKIDQNGWEYGNNAWKQLSGVPGMQTFTRRRRWCRRARLVEWEEENYVVGEDEAKKKK